MVESLNSLRFLCFTFCTSIQALLSAPNPDDPLSENIAKHWKTNEAEAVETGQLIVCLEHYCFMLLFMLCTSWIMQQENGLVCTQLEHNDIHGEKF